MDGGRSASNTDSEILANIREYCEQAIRDANHELSRSEGLIARAFALFDVPVRAIDILTLLDGADLDSSELLG